MRIWFQVPKKHFLEPLQIESPWEISILRGAFFWAFSIVILVVNSIYKCWNCILTRLWTTSVGRSICEIHRFANCIYLYMLRLLQIIWVGNLNFTENFIMLEVLILWVWESTKRMPMSLHGIFMLCHYKYHVWSLFVLLTFVSIQLGIWPWKLTGLLGIQSGFWIFVAIQFFYFLFFSIVVPVIYLLCFKNRLLLPICC
jgi:hypothetical protein